MRWVSGLINLLQDDEQTPGVTDYDQLKTKKEMEEKTEYQHPVETPQVKIIE